MHREETPGRQEGQQAENWQKYDFRRPRRLSRSRSAALSEVYQNYARLLSFCISSAMKRCCTVRVLRVEERKYLHFYNSLDEREPVALARMQAEGLPGGQERLLLARCWPELVYGMMLTALGDENGLSAPERPWTDTERTLCEEVMRELFSFLEDAWSKLLKAKFTFLGFETAGEILRHVNLNEDCVIISLEVEAEGRGGQMSFCLSADTLEEAFRVWESADETREIPKSGEENFTSILEVMMESELELSAVFGYTRLFMKELSELQVGDVLKVQRPVGDGVELYVEDQPWRCGTLGIYKGSYAVNLINLAQGRKSGVKHGE